MKMAVLPADARLTFRDVREAGGALIPLLTAASPASASRPGDPVTVSGVDRPWETRPAPEDGALGVWFDPGRPGSERVELDDETRERLRALGYTM